MASTVLFRNQALAAVRALLSLRLPARGVLSAMFSLLCQRGSTEKAKKNPKKTKVEIQSFESHGFPLERLKKRDFCYFDLTNLMKIRSFFKCKGFSVLLHSQRLSAISPHTLFFWGGKETIRSTSFLSITSCCELNIYGLTEPILIPAK